MRKHYKVLKIEKKNNKRLGGFITTLDIWIKKKGKYLEYAKMFDEQFNDEFVSYLGTSLDESGKYIILTFVLRNEKDLINYIITPTDEYKKFGKKMYKKLKEGLGK